MSAFFLGAACVLLASVAAGLVRVRRGPTAIDRMLAAQLVGTGGAAMLVLLAEVMAVPAARDVALVLALLAALTAVGFVRGRAHRRGAERDMRE